MPVASKHAVLGLTESAALEYASASMRVNAVSPGAIETPMFDRFTEGLGAEDAARIVVCTPMGRTGRPRKSPKPCFGLCSDQASFVTGQSLAVDGGWTAQ